MSGCESFREEISAYLDGELAASRRLELERHLAGCASCQEVLDAQRWLLERLRELSPPEPSPQFEARLRARIAREADEARGLRTRIARGLRLPALQWGFGAAALGLLAVLLWLRPGNSIPQEEWEILADAEQFELLQHGELELLAALHLLEGWDEAEEI